ncbi:MAG: RNA polymerase sigma factor [Bacteroidota bacterium]
MGLTDQDIIEGCLNGKRTYQKALYDKFRVPLFRLCMRYAHDRSEAEDMLQDGFIKIFTDLHQFSRKGPLGAWMRRVMLNTALQAIRKRKKLFPTVEVETVADQYASKEDVFAQLGHKALTQLIQQLPTGYRTVFNLYVIEGFSHQEIAEQLNITASTSKTQLFKAKATLRKMLEKIMIS